MSGARASRIVCAALRLGSRIVVGPRHFDATMRPQVAAYGGDWARAEQGFIDQFGEFYSRTGAMVIAVAGDQLRAPEQPGAMGLCSEDLY